VGGQIVLVGLLPTARGISPGAPRALARAFARLAWPAYALLVATGIWNVAVVKPGQQGTAYQVVLGFKLLAVAVAGLATLAHGRAQTPKSTAIWGSFAGVASIAALFLGVLLAG
jgi:hypothetical protein